MTTNHPKPGDRYVIEPAPLLGKDGRPCVGKNNKELLPGLFRVVRRGTAQRVAADSVLGSDSIQAADSIPASERIDPAELMAKSDSLRTSDTPELPAVPDDGSTTPLLIQLQDQTVEMLNRAVDEIEMSVPLENDTVPPGESADNAERIGGKVERVIQNLRAFVGDYLEKGDELRTVRDVTAMLVRFDHQTNGIYKEGEAVPVTADEGGRVVRLDIHPPTGSSDAVLDLLRDVGRAATMVMIVLPRHDAPLFSPFWFDHLPDKVRNLIAPISSEVRQRQDVYLRQLAQIARFPISQPTSAAQAARDLDAFRERFVAMEADAVKSKHIRKLGWCAAGMASALLAARL